MAQLELVQNLEELGFSPKEAHVYLILLELKRALPSTIARKAGLKRPSIYGLLKRLLHRGIIVEEQEKGYTFFQAIEPKFFLAQQREHFEEMSQNLQALEKSLPAILNKHKAYQIPSPKIIQDLDGTAEIIIREASDSLSPIAGLLLVDEEEKMVCLKEMSGSKAGKIMLKILGKDYKKIRTPYDKPKNHIGRAVAEKRTITGNNLRDFFCPSLPTDISDKIQKLTKIKRIVACPAIIDGKVIGGIIIGFQSKEQMEARSHQIESFMNQAAIALKNAYKYEKIKHQYEVMKKEFTESIKTIKKKSKSLIKISKSHDLEDHEKIGILGKLQEDILAELNGIERSLSIQNCLSQSHK